MNNRQLEEVIELKLDMVDALGEEKGTAVTKKAFRQMKVQNMSPERTERFFDFLRKQMGVPKKDKTLLKPTPRGVQAIQTGDKVTPKEALAMKPKTPGISVEVRQSGVPTTAPVKPTAKPMRKTTVRTTPMVIREQPIIIVHSISPIYKPGKSAPMVVAPMKKIPPKAGVRAKPKKKFAPRGKKPRKSIARGKDGRIYVKTPQGVRAITRAPARTEAQRQAVHQQRFPGTKVPPRGTGRVAPATLPSGAPIVGYKPRRKVRPQAGKLADVDDLPGDAIDANFGVGNPYGEVAVQDVKPVPDVNEIYNRGSEEFVNGEDGDQPEYGIGTYPYPAEEVPGADEVPPRLDGDGIGYIPDYRNPSEPDEIFRRGYAYPYPARPVPGANEVPMRIDDLGTLQPPRPLLKPWQTAKQKLFHPGDWVITKQDRRVGLIRAIRGEMCLVSFGVQNRMEKIPMQDLAIYYGTVRQLKRNEGRRVTDLSKVVGKTPSR